jgi:hypothetical protein
MSSDDNRPGKATAPNFIKKSGELGIRGGNRFDLFFDFKENFPHNNLQTNRYAD